MPHQNKNLIVNVHLEYWFIKWHIVSPTSTCTLLPLSFMWFYDDILIKMISHGVGRVIKNIPTHTGFITALLRQMEDTRTEDKRRMNAGYKFKCAALFRWPKLWRKTERRCAPVLPSDFILNKCRYSNGTI